MRVLLASAALAGSLAAAAWAADAPAPPALKVGDRAPDFKLSASDGKEYTLKQFAGNSAVVIAWYPKAMTDG